MIEREVAKLFFELYISLPAELISKVFQVLVQLASVRRMLFDTSDRLKYLDQIVCGIKLVLENPEKLQDQVHYFHILNCRIYFLIAFLRKLLK